MADVINLRLARKARARSKAADQAAQNRALHGQSGTQRKLNRSEAARADRLLDGHRREQED